MKKTLKILSIILIISLLFSGCGNAVKVKTVKFAEENIVDSVYAGKEFHTSAENSYRLLCKSGLIELYFNEKTMTPAIRDTNNKFMWSAVPDVSTSKELKNYTFEITLSNGDENTYILNTQDNSVAFSNAVPTFSEKGVSVKYALSLDKESGQIPVNESDENAIRADIVVDYTLNDGSFYVNISMNNVELPKKVHLEKISVLNGFGAYEESGEDDYIFVPDGSGAIIKTGIEDSNFKPISLNVYGEDIALSENFTVSHCLFGAYGIKRGNNAFVCIIEKGDTIAQINAQRNSDTSYNSVYPTFKTTDVVTSKNGKTKKAYGSEYKNEITLCYRFLAGKSATYSGMATATRENLIRNSILSTQIFKTNENDIPLVLSLQGGYIDKNGKYNILSNFQSSLSLLQLLKAKGVNNIYLRYNGLYKEANNGAYRDLDEIKSSLGSKKDFNALYNYIQKQNFKLFSDIDILSYKYGISETANSIYHSNIDIVKNPDAPFPSPISKQSFLKLSSLPYRIENILSSSKKITFDGYALNDIGSYLYSDYSGDFYNRESSKKEISAQMPVLSNSKMIMLDTGNIYAIKNTNVVSNIPLEPFEAVQNNAYVGIPFIQMMLHGTTEYSSVGANSKGDMKLMFLKSVEYGCLPSIDWYCTSYDNVLDENYYYDKNINEAVKYYEKANKALCDLRDARMTSHIKISDGVYCTEYKNSAKIYVNYTAEPVTIQSITIPPTDFVRV